MIFNPRIGLSISSLSCKIVPSGGYNSHSDRVKSLLRHVTNESPSQLSITNYNVELSPVANKKQTPSLSKKDNRYLLSKEKKEQVLATWQKIQDVFTSSECFKTEKIIFDTLSNCYSDIRYILNELGFDNNEILVIANFGAPDSFRVDDIELLYEDFQDSNCIDFMFRTIAKLWIYTSTFLFRDENEFQKDLRYVRLLCILLVTRYYNYFLLQNKIDIKNKEYKQLQYDILLKQQECELFLLELTLVFFMGLNDSGRRKIVHKNQQDKEIAALKKVYNTILEKKIGKFTEKLLEESSFFTDDLRIQPPLSSRL